MIMTLRGPTTPSVRAGSFRGFFGSSTRQACTWYEKAAAGPPTTSGACSDQLHPPDLAWARTCNEKAAAAGHTTPRKHDEFSKMLRLTRVSTPCCRRHVKTDPEASPEF